MFTRTKGKGGGGWAEWRQIARICWDGGAGGGQKSTGKEGKSNTKHDIRLPETCRVVIPIKLEFSASVGFITRDSSRCKVIRS